MKRREALKTLGFATIGLVALPSCTREWFSDEITPGLTAFSSKEQKLMSSLADTFIPEKNSVGAISQGIDKFLIRLFDKCYEKDVQDNIKLQLSKLDEKAIDSTGKAFTDCSQSQREELLLTFSESGDEDETNFFRLVKGETIRGFRTSKVVMQDYYGYRVVPAHYDGNVDVEA